MKDDTKEIIVLGIGNCFSPEITNTSYLYSGNDSVELIDCGYNVFEALKKNFPEHLKLIDNVYITHLHPDHVGSLPALILYRYFMFGECTNVVCAQSLLNELQSYLRSTTSCCERKGLDSSSFLQEPSRLYQISYGSEHKYFFPVLHGPTKAFGLKFGGNVLFTGDCFFIPDSFQYLLDDKIEHIFHDTYLGNEFNLVHSPFKLFPKYYPKEVLKKMIYVHHGIAGIKTNLPKAKYGHFGFAGHTVRI
jgi:phosphoribosyl 1,2-cyclic phosphodiesterase